MLEYYPGKTLIHRFDIRTKVLAFTVLTVFLFLFKSPLFTLGLVLFTTLLMVYIRIPIARLAKLLKPLFPIMVIIVILSGFTYPVEMFKGEIASQILFYAWPGQHLPFSVGGFLLGVTLMLRIYAMVLLTSILTFSTPLEEFIHLMRVMRLPQPITFIIVTGIRFIPTMQKKVDQVFDAQKARGASFSTGGIFGPIINFVPIMVPLIVDSLRMSENLAISMLNRGYGASKKWTPLKELRMTWIDQVMIPICILFLLITVYLKIEGYGTI